MVDPPHDPASFNPLNKYILTKLKDLLKPLGLDGSNSVILAAAPGLDSDSQKKDKLLNDHLKAHKEAFDSCVKKIAPKLILTFGKSAARQVVGRPVQIMKARGLPFKSESYNCMVLPMLNLYQVIRVPEYMPIMNADIRMAKNLYDNDFKYTNKDDVKKDYKWCTDLQFLIDMNPDELSVDVETAGGWWHQPDFRILTVQLCWEPGKAVIVPLTYNYKDGQPPSQKLHDKLVDQLHRLLHKRTKCFGHNFKYDWIALYTQYGIECNYEDDSILLVHAVDENLTNKNIDDSVRVFVPEMAGFNDIYNKDPIHQDKSRMDLLPPEKMLPYGCGDVDAAWRLKTLLVAMLKKDAKAFKCYKEVVMPANRAFCWIEQVGFFTDLSAMKKFQKQLQIHQEREKAYIFSHIPNAIKEKYVNTGKGLSLTRDAILRDYLFTHPAGLNLEPLQFTKSSTASNKIPSVSSKTHLPYFFDSHPITLRIAEYKKNEKLLNTYIKQFYKYVSNGKIYPSYLLFVTDTGRTASRDPNGQNFPKRGKLAKQYRKTFVAPPGYVLIEADLSQIELRIVAALSGDKNMLNAYRKDGDLHSTTAANSMRLTLEAFMQLDKEVRKEKRTQAKAVNFGFIYGMWWKKFKVYAKTEYGIDYNDEQAAAMREMFFRAYPAILSWHRNVEEFVTEHGYVRSMSGRVRHLPSARSADESTRKEAIRKAINAPVQEFGNTLGLLSLDRIQKEVPRKKAKTCGFVHDAIIAIAKIEDAAFACREIKRIMETNDLKKLFGITFPIPIKAEVSIGMNLGEMYEIPDSILEDKSVVTSADIYKKLGVSLEPKPEVTGKKVKPPHRRIRL